MDTSFRLKNQTFNPALQSVGNKAVSAAAPVLPKAPPAITEQAESFVPSTPLRTPRPGSDMDLMVQDLQDNGVIPGPQAEAAAPQAPVKLREPNSDYMADLVESVKVDQGWGHHSMHVAVNSNGSIAVLDDHTYLPEELDNSPKAHDDGHGHAAHGHGFKEDGLLGGHMGTEIIEKLGHNAHHAASHAVGHATDGASHAVTEAAGHGTAKAATEAVGHGTAKAAAESTAKVGAKVAAESGAKAAAEGGAKVAAQGASKAAAHGAELAHAGVETSAEAADVTTAQLATVGKEAAHHLSTAMEVALGVGTVGAGLLAVPLTLNGVKELKHGIKEKSTEKILEGVGGIAVGTRSAATAAVMGGMLTTSEVVGQVAGVAASTLTPLGLVHAGVDAVLGVRDLTKGKTTEGLLKIGTGAAIGAAAVIGGLPLTLAAIGMLGVKVGHKIYSKVQQNKAAAQEPSQQAPQPSAEQLSTASNNGLSPDSSVGRTTPTSRT